MPMVTTKDSVEIFHKDWGKGHPIVFSHGWPLSADDWDAQMLSSSIRAIASSPMTVADTAGPARWATVTTWITTPTISPRWSRISIWKTPHVGHSTGGGGVVHYLGRDGESRVAQRRRSDRSVRRIGANVGQATEEWNPNDLDSLSSCNRRPASGDSHQPLQAQID